MCLHMCGRVLRSKTTHMQMHGRPANVVSELEQLVMRNFLYDVAHVISSS